MEDDKKNYYGLDVLKLICSILVLCIHTSPLASYSSEANFILVNIISKVAVPIFFVCSGYLFFKKIRNQSNLNSLYVFKKYICRLMSVYFIWLTIYSPLIIYTLFNSINESINIKKIIWIMTFFFNYYQLWYFPAVILSIFIVFILARNLKMNIIIKISSIFYAMGVIIPVYCEIIGTTNLLTKLYDGYLDLFITVRNGLFFGFIYVAIGAYIAFKQLRNINKSASFILIILFFFLLSVEVNYLRKFDFTGEMYFSLLPLVISIFIFFKDLNLVEHNRYTYFRKLSTLIFLTHGMINVIVRNSGINIIQNNSLISFITVFILSGIISSVIIKLSELSKYKFLNKIY